MPGWVSALSVFLLCSWLISSATCQQQSSVCSRPREAGPCYDYVTRWFYDSEFGSCLRFWYGGCEGNGNNFDTEEACSRVCVDPPGAAVCLLPAVHGSCSDEVRLWYFQPDTGLCDQFLYGGCYGNGNRFDSQKACEERCGGLATGAPACRQPDRVTGPCTNYSVRYSYVASHQQCAPFYYGGCPGNDNNFDSLEECQERCAVPEQTQPEGAAGVAGTDEEGSEHENGTASQQETNAGPGVETLDTGNSDLVDICLLTEDSGPCLGYEPMFFYDHLSDNCYQFIYGGCGGNGNRFNTHEECKKKCDMASAGHLQISADICSLPPEPGTCDDYQPRFYYSPSLDGCYRFTYTGCGGNGNRFLSESQCRTSCVHQNTHDQRPPTPSTRLDEAAATHGPVLESTGITERTTVGSQTETTISDTSATTATPTELETTPSAPDSALTELSASAEPGPRSPGIPGLPGSSSLDWPGPRLPGLPGHPGSPPSGEGYHLGVFDILSCHDDYGSLTQRGDCHGRRLGSNVASSTDSQVPRAHLVFPLL